MAGNSIGRMFRVTNWGESHGRAIGVVIEGCPPLIELREKDIQRELDKRKPGQNKLTTAREEEDKVNILSGVFNGRSTGTPISLIIYNNDSKKKDYEKISKIFRPGHADFTYNQKYGIRDYNGGGRSSARITAGNVAAGAIAKKILKEKLNVEIIAYVKKIKDIEADIDYDSINISDIESSEIRCPDKETAKKMIKIIEEARKHKDSVGGIVECIIKNVPAGLGEPVFDKLDSELAKSIMSINAVKAFEIGAGTKSGEMYGSQNNDIFFMDSGKFKTSTNNSGGILGGISNGMPIILRATFKPTPSISRKQKTVDINGKEKDIQIEGRHDPCVLPRAVSVVEAMAAITICDHYLRNKAQCGGLK